MANIELTTVTGTALDATRGGFARVHGHYPALSRAAVLSVAIPSDVTIISTLGFDAPGDGGAASYMELPGAPSLTTNPAYLHLGSRWFGLLPSYAVNVMQFGFKADYVRNVSGTDNLAAFNHVKAFVTSFAPHCPSVVVPPGAYKFSGPLVFKGGAMKWLGAGSGREYHLGGGPATAFWFPPNTSGIVVATHSTDAYGVTAVEGVGGDGTIIEGIAVVSESDGYRAATEINASYTATNTEPTFTGASGAGGGLRDGLDAANSTVWATASAAGGTITADLGSSQQVDLISVQCIPSTFGGWGPAFIDGAAIAYSTNGTSWTSIGSVSGTGNGVSVRLSIGAVCRYIRLTKTDNFFGLAEFRVYQNANFPCDGFWLRARASLRDVQGIGFGRDGLNIEADVSGITKPLGNANLFNVSHFTFRNNGRNGIYADGGDANAGEGFMGNCSFNLSWGVHDASAIRNTWFAMHTEGNGYNGGANWKFAHHDGTVWLVKRGAASFTAATEPGTDPAIWQPWYDTPSPDALSIAWVGQPFQDGGPYAGGGLFYGVYMESGQGPCDLSTNAIFHPIVNEQGYFPDTQAGIQVGQAFKGGVSAFPLNSNSVGVFVGVGGDEALGTVFGAQDTRYGLFDNYQRLRFLSTGDIVFDDNHQFPYWLVTGPETTTTFGRTAPVPYVFNPNRLIIPGNVEITSGTAAPTTGEHKRGDIVWNSNVTSGQPEGWRCTVSGTPGTWTAMANHP